MSVQVLTPGWSTSIQDLGRRGHTAIGVGTAGAMDGVALRLANALVGNGDEAAGLEITLRGPRLHFDADAIVALTGAAIDAVCAGGNLPMWRPVLVHGGAEIVLGAMPRGARSYLAFAGGIEAASLLGSRSTDINAALGPFAGRALQAGDVLQLGAPSEPQDTLMRGLASRQANDGEADATFSAPNWSLDPAPWFEDRTTHTIGLIRGVHFDALEGRSQKALATAEFRVGNESNRVGYRLGGPTLKLRSSREMISEGTVPGTMQLPPSGEPIVLMAEAPTTGGYPRIGHVASVDLPRLAQCRPGDRLRFAEISLGDAQTRYLEREQRLAALVRNIGERLTLKL